MREAMNASSRWIEYLVSNISMDTQQLLAFQRVVREGSFSRAALTLDIGQPALSARIQALEAKLGGALFSRGRRVALTPLGTAFLPYARRALETLEEGARVARSAQSGIWLPRTRSCSSLRSCARACLPHTSGSAPCSLVLGRCDVRGVGSHFDTRGLRASLRAAASRAVGEAVFAVLPTCSLSTC
jgi:hypothetical protein